MSLPTLLTEPNKVCRLNKAIYGLKQANRRWSDYLGNFLTKLGFVKSKSDPCLFTCGKSPEAAIYVAVYVDDLLVAAKSLNSIDKFKKDITHNLKMTDGGPATYYIGVQITCDASAGSLSLSQLKYSSDLIERFNMEHSKPMSTPLTAEISYSKDMSSPTLSKTTPYREAIGCLNYAAVLTRPDLSTAVGQLSRFVTSPQEAHWIGVKHVLRYLNSSKDLSLNYRRSTSFELVGYCDASYAGDTDSRKSTSGYVFMLGGAAVSWSSKQQSTVATSTMEAELISAWSAAAELIHLRNLLTDFLIPPSKPTLMNTDSQPIINSISSGSISLRTKHIDIKYRSLEEHILTGKLILTYLPTADMPADFLTKNLSKEKFLQFRDFICGYGN
jgi:hypothetical protein